ncbi:uncharacterized protein LOC111705308 [Eurytemora carolleeae]|uniref:uncharacterized protein LOC111705308 n=1 Tax=Eurytemora carolleeae TaxID=1294199 RepID=UPI000C76F506|nr:uncharacterized protein LOC111705308 [Eurytemora carolleeae]|eukprot:XP_023333577.1 uncharacterized protein LOC111705308 [Eurytemora affinis]
MTIYLILKSFQLICFTVQIRMKLDLVFVLIFSILYTSKGMKYLLDTEETEADSADGTDYQSGGSGDSPNPPPGAPAAPSGPAGPAPPAGGPGLMDGMMDFIVDCFNKFLMFM